MKKKVSEKTLTSKQAVTQMNHYWKDLDHMASDVVKKKNMDMRFGIKDIKLDRYGNITSFNKYNRLKGTYGNRDKKDASHKGGKIVGMEDENTNRGRAEKSRLVGSKRKKT